MSNDIAEIWQEEIWNWTNIAFPLITTAELRQDKSVDLELRGSGFETRRYPFFLSAICLVFVCLSVKRNRFFSRGYRYARKEMITFFDSALDTYSNVMLWGGQHSFPLSRINKRVYLCLFEHANTRKHVHEHSGSSVRVFLSILAHLAQSFFTDFKRNDLKKWIYSFLSMQIQESMSVSIAGHLVWVNLSIFAYLAHLAQSYFSLIVSAIKTYNCSGLIQTNKNNCNDLQWLKIKALWKIVNAYDCFPHGDSRHYW